MVTEGKQNEMISILSITIFFGFSSGDSPFLAYSNALLPFIFTSEKTGGTCSVSPSNFFIVF